MFESSCMMGTRPHAWTAPGSPMLNAFKAHVNVGFFRGAEIADPENLLEGTGRFMRHVKLRPAEDKDAGALRGLIHTAYADIKRRLEAETNGAA